jgi:hypothetical protein
LLSVQERSVAICLQRASSPTFLPSFPFRSCCPCCCFPHLSPQTLVQSLALVAGALPELLEDIQGQLLDLLSLMLARKPFCPTTDRAECQALLNSLAGSELAPGAAVQLALNTLGTFDFGKVGPGGTWGGVLDPKG